MLLQLNFIQRDPGDEDGTLNPVWSFEPGKL